MDVLTHHGVAVTYMTTIVNQFRAVILESCKYAVKLLFRIDSLGQFHLCSLFSNAIVQKRKKRLFFIA